MFAYCLNNPVNGCDPCGTCFHRWDFWNDCEKCGGKTIGDKWDDFTGWCSETFGAGVVIANSYEQISIDTLFGGVESGYSTSGTLFGDVSKPVCINDHQNKNTTQMNKLSLDDADCFLEKLCDTALILLAQKILHTHRTSKNEYTNRLGLHRSIVLSNLCALLQFPGIFTWLIQFSGVLYTQNQADGSVYI